MGSRASLLKDKEFAKTHSSIIAGREHRRRVKRTTLFPWREFSLIEHIWRIGWC